MKYIIMCGGNYPEWDIPRHMIKINGEEIVARTIRLLRENCIKDISISSHDSRFMKYGVPVLGHKNQYVSKGYNNDEGYWCDAFYPTDEPTCYIFGDVVFSPDAIRKIVETETDDIEFFASAPPYGDGYIKPYQEPFAFKVVNTDHLKQAIIDCKRYDKAGKFWRRPIAWELWAVIKGGDLNDVYRFNYTAIRDYTCDIDHESDIPAMEKAINGKA